MSVSDTGIIGQSTSLAEVFRTLTKVAPTDSTVLVTGESGTGKEVFAQAMHNASPRSRGPFLALNCATLAPNFIESELFGYADGAFTGAKRGGKEGFFEVADGGTLFLDEVTELSTEAQAKLLRVLQEKAVRRVGETDEIPMDVRVIAASNRNMREMVDKGLFRSDLFYRLNALHLEVPPLRDRRDDIPLLARFFARRIWKQPEEDAVFDPAALAALCRYPWPGNVRELRNAVEYASHMGSGSRIVPSSLPANIFSLPEGASPAERRMDLFDATRSLDEIVAQAEKTAICAKLRERGEDLAAKKAIAAELGISLTTLYAKISKHGI